MYCSSIVIRSIIAIIFCNYYWTVDANSSDEKVEESEKRLEKSPINNTDISHNDNNYNTNNNTSNSSNSNSNSNNNNNTKIANATIQKLKEKVKPIKLRIGTENIILSWLIL